MVLKYRENFGIFWSCGTREKVEFMFELLVFGDKDGLRKMCYSEVNSIGLETRLIWFEL